MGFVTITLIALILILGISSYAYLKNSNYPKNTFRRVFVILSSISVILLIISRTSLLQIIWTDFHPDDDFLFFLATLLLFICAIIILIKAIRSKRASFLVSADTILIVIPIILIFLFELIIFENHVPRKRIDQISNLDRFVETNNEILDDYLINTKSDSTWIELYDIIDEAWVYLIDQSGGIKADSMTYHGSNSDFYPNILIIKDGHLNKIKVSLKNLIYYVDETELKNEIRELITNHLGNAAINNTVAEMSLRLKLLISRLKLIELRQVKNDT